MINMLVLPTPIFAFGEEHKKQVAILAPEVLVRVAERGELTADMLKNAEIIYGWPRSEQIKQAESLKWLHLPSAGADSYVDRSIYCNQDIVVTNSTGVFGLPIAEHVFAMILAFNKNLHVYVENKNNSQWKTLNTKKDIYGSTFGIIGLGDIGSEVAKRAHSWGANVIAVKRTPGDKPDYIDELYGEDGIDQLLKISDYVVLALPNTGKTAGMISKERLKKMKKDAFIVNIGRGSLIDQDALIMALKEGWIAGAGLDVTTPEPLPQDSPLWKLPNLILTPHVSGGSPTTNDRRFNIFCENLKRYVERKALMNIVDFEAGY